MNKKVTILMPVYNGEKYIAEAIISILDQTFKNFELLIINDGSTDKTKEIIKYFRDTRIRLIENPKNLGLVLTRNIGLKESNGDYIAFLDSDDMAYPSRIEKQINFLEKNQDFGMIGSWAKIINKKGKATGEYWKSFLSPQKIPIELLFNNYFIQSSIMVRRDIALSELYRDGFSLAEDYDLWVRIAKKTMTWNMPNFLVKYRIHGENISKTSLNLLKQYTEKIIILQLKDLDIIPSEEELKIHQMDFSSLNFSKKEIIEKEGLWLEKLKKSNLIKKIYSEKEFSEYISERWLRICMTNINLGPWVLNKFFKSELKKNINFKSVLVLFKKFVSKLKNNLSKKLF